MIGTTDNLIKIMLGVDVSGDGWKTNPGTGVPPKHKADVKGGCSRGACH